MLVVAVPGFYYFILNEILKFVSVSTVDLTKQKQIWGRCFALQHTYTCIHTLLWTLDSWLRYPMKSLCSLLFAYLIFLCGHQASCAWKTAMVDIETVKWNFIKWKHFPHHWPFCAGNSPVTGEFPTQRPVMQSFDVFFALRLNKRLSKQSWGCWFETPSRP